MERYGGGSLEETISRLKELAVEAEILAQRGQHAALTHHLLKIGRVVYSAIALTEIPPTGDLLVDLRNHPSSTSV